jgi:cytoskeleton protein RodZ
MDPGFPPGGIGSKLQEARERAGLSLRQVSGSTKVPVDILQALERNSVARIPGGLYTRGYARSFASAVGLDPETVVAELVAQFPSGAVASGYPGVQQPEAGETRDLTAAVAPSSSRRIGRKSASASLRFAAVGVVTLAIGGYLGVSLGTRQQPDPSLARARPASAADAPGARGDATVRTVSPRDPGEPSPAPAADAPVEVAAAVLAPHPAGQLAAAVPVEAEPDRVPGLAPPLAVVVAAKSPSWVIATVDGRRAVNRLLQGGERETLEARRDLVLTAGDAGAIVMTLNGRLARSIGRSGETVTAYLNNANFRDYLRP